MDPLVKTLVMAGSVSSIGFGVWHFFVPAIWRWYSYIDANATELVVAIRAINVFFSLSLVLFGVVNVLFIYGDQSNRYSVVVMLAATSILWLTRVALQIIYPQGSMIPSSSIWYVIGFPNRVNVLPSLTLSCGIPIITCEHVSDDGPKRPVLMNRTNVRIPGIIPLLLDCKPVKCDEKISDYRSGYAGPIHIPNDHLRHAEQPD